MSKRIGIAGVVACCLSVACGGHTLAEQGSGSPAGGAGTDVRSTSTTATTGGMTSPPEGAGGVGSVPACVSGRSIGCACPTGQSGAQVCGTDGTYASCVCEEEGGAPDALLLSPADCPCTRRPGPGNSSRCPVGVGQSVSMTMGKAGGKISINGQQFSRTSVPFSVEIPPGALDGDILITVTETASPPPSTFTDYSPIYLVEPIGLATTIPLPIVIGAANKDGAIDRSLAIYAGPALSGPFQRVPDSYVNAGFMQASVKRLGAFLAGYPKNLAEGACP